MTPSHQRQSKQTGTSHSTRERRNSCFSGTVGQLRQPIRVLPSRLPLSCLDTTHQALWRLCIAWCVTGSGSTRNRPISRGRNGSCRPHPLLFRLDSTSRQSGHNPSRSSRDCGHRSHTPWVRFIAGFGNSTPDRFCRTRHGPHLPQPPLAAVFGYSTMVVLRGRMVRLHSAHNVRLERRVVVITTTPRHATRGCRSAWGCPGVTSTRIRGLRAALAAL